MPKRERGDEVKMLRLANAFAEEAQQEYYTAGDLSTRYDEEIISPLFVLSDEGDLEVVSEMDQFRMRPEDRILALVGPGLDVQPPSDAERVPDAESSAEEEPVFEVVDPAGEERDGRAK